MLPSFSGKIIGSCFDDDDDDDDDNNVDDDDDLISCYSRTPSGARKGSPSTPTTPRTPRGERRFRTDLELYLSPQPVQKQPAPAPAGQRQVVSTIPPETSSDPGRRVLRARRAEINYSQAYSDEEPDISGSESGDEFVPDSGAEEGEDEQQEEGEKAVPEEEEIADDVIPIGTVPESDDESDDEDDVRDLRRRNRAQFWIELQENIRKVNNAWTQPDYWNCKCKRCLEMIGQFIVKPSIKSSTKWNRFKNDAPKEVWDMVMKGELPKGKKVAAWKNIASTPTMYVDGMRKLLGQLQKELQESDVMRARLDDGKLHMWQLLEFHKEKHIEFPEDVMPLIEKIQSPNMQKFAFSGYKQLLESTIKWLASIEGGVPMFTIKTKRVEGMTEEEYQEKFREDSVKSRDNRLRESRFLTQILNNMKTNKPWATFDGDIEYWKEQKTNYLSSYAGQTEVDSSCITRLV